MRIARFMAGRPKSVTAAICALIAVVSIATTRFELSRRFHQPYTIQIATNQSAAAVVSRAGSLLPLQWGTGTKDSVLDARMITSDSRQFAGVLYGGTAAPDDARQFKFYNIASPLVALWKTDVEPASYNPPRQVANPETECYTAGQFLFADVLPNPPTEPTVECIVYLRSRNGPWTCIQIRHTLSGRILKQFWHRGHLAGPIHWAGLSRQLVFCAASNNRRWKDVGTETPPKDLYPRVIFAVDPAAIPDSDPAALITDRVSPDDRRSFAAAWYRCLFPSDHYDLFDFNITTFREPASPGRMGKSVAVIFATRNDPGVTVEFVIDATGTAREGVPSFAAHDRFPQLAAKPLYFGPLPK